MLQVLLRSRSDQVEVSHLPCDPVYPPEVGYLGSLAMWYPLRYMDYATQSSRVGARVPYSLLKVPLLASIYYHFVGDVVWLCQLVCPWHLAQDTYVPS